MSQPWYADAPKQFLFNFFQNYRLPIPVFNTRFQNGGYTCLVRLPPMVTEKMGHLPASVPVLDPENAKGVGKNKKDAENLAARNGCDILAALGLLTRNKKGVKMAVVADTNGAAYMPAVAPDLLKGLLPVAGTEGFLGNPKSEFSNTFSRMGWHLPDYNNVVYAGHQFFRCIIRLPPGLIQRIQEYRSQCQDQEQATRLDCILRERAIIGQAKAKKDAVVAAAIQGCVLLSWLGLIGAKATGAGPAPLHFRLPVPHEKGEFTCDKVHDIEPDQLALNPDQRRDIEAMIMHVEQARAEGRMTLPPAEPAPMFRGGQDKDNRPSPFEIPLEPMAQAMAESMRAQLALYWAGQNPAANAKWGMGRENVLATRKKLPVYTMRDEIIRTIHSNQVTVLSGETGCGKTTQIPQYLLEHYIETGFGPRAKIICTQPRRISAISVAERVAYEKGENLGETVGYKIRLEGVVPRSAGSILFCTTGVLLRMLLSDDALRDVSHLVVDEIHERDLFSDFLLIVLRDLLPRRPYLKVVLMSATLDAQLFSNYFSQAGYPCPVIQVPGFMHPVTAYYLEDVLYSTNFDPTPYLGTTNREKEAMKRNMGMGRRDRLLMANPVPSSATTDNLYYDSGMTRQYGTTVVDRVRQIESNDFPLPLVVDTVSYLCRTQAMEGAILVFLPGWEEITTVKRLLDEQLARDVGGGRVVVHALHSQLPTLNQRAVFDKPPPGVRKIVLATNIAETSITIDDVVFVVDSGRHKEKSYDPKMGLQALQMSWESQANKRQRMGRAGRVASGHCFFLFSRARAQTLKKESVPEMLRVPLEELVLQIKVLGLRGGDASQVLSNAIQPPSQAAVADAMNTLMHLGALDQNLAMTPLGKVVAQIPVEVRLAKMLLWSVLLRCADPVITITSALSMKAPWVMPAGDMREQADRCRRAFAGEWRSDHIALLNAYNAWLVARREGREHSFCDQNFLSNSTMNTIEKIRRQYMDLLQGAGFPVTAEANTYAHSVPLVKAVIYSALYPNVVHIGAARDGGKQPKFMSFNNCSLKPHPRSACSDVYSFNHRWLAFSDKVKITAVFCDVVTMVTSASLLLLGSCPQYMEVDLAPQPQGYPSNPAGKMAALVSGGWMVVKTSPDDARLLLEVHRAVAEMLMCCVASPTHGYNEAHTDTIVGSLASLIHRSETNTSLPAPPPSAMAPTAFKAMPLSYTPVPGMSPVGTPYATTPYGTPLLGTRPSTPSLAPTNAMGGFAGRVQMRRLWIPGTKT